VVHCSGLESPRSDTNPHALEPVRQPTPGPAPSGHRASGAVDGLEKSRPEPNAPHTVLEPLPTLNIELVSELTGPPVPVASRSQANEKVSVNTNKNSKLKNKKKGILDFTMDDALLDRRLLAVGPDFEVDLDRITHQQVGPISRAIMSDIFGGSPQRMISYPSLDKQDAHGFISPLLFPSREFNPLLPGKIGEGGLLFRLDHKLKQWVDDTGGVGPYHLMMHHTPEDYCYFGIYRFVRVDTVTKDEWMAQSSQVCYSARNIV
jgi:hypothetical protein